MKQQGKPVDLIAVTPFKLDGEHIAIDTVLKNVDADLASELTGAGRTELATPERVKAAEERAAAAAAAAEAALKAAAKAAAKGEKAEA